MKNYKVYVPTESHSKRVLEHALKLGYRWYGDEESVKNIEKHFLFFGRFITYGNDNDFESFKKNERLELTVEEFLALTPEDVKENPVFKPFDRVLVKRGNEWYPDFFSRMRNGRYATITDTILDKGEILPYKGNEHLLNQ